MLIDLTSICSREGSSKSWETSLGFAEFTTGRESYPVGDASQVNIFVKHVENQILDVQVEAEVSVDIPCSRCLEPVRNSFRIEENRRVDMKLSQEEIDNMLGESGCITGKILDTDVLMHNEILERWPMQVLCKKDCLGICPKCGSNRNRRSCKCDTALPDPRMAAIKDIFNNFKEV